MFASGEMLIFDDRLKRHRSFLMKHKQTTKHLAVETFNQTVWKLIGPSADAADRLRASRQRFAIYGYLSAIYRTYRNWRRHKRAIRNARKVAQHIGITFRKGMSPFRVLIEATSPLTDPKQKSRWVRALQYAWLQHVLPRHLVEFFQQRKGISGCAGFAARLQPKKAGRWDDWAT
jgi:hypothetical protein